MPCTPVAVKPPSTQVNDPIIIIGTGPVGVRFVDELRKLDPDTPVILFGDEPWEAYNRVKLSHLLAGDVGLDQLSISQNITSDDNTQVYYHCRIQQIQPEHKRVVDAQGRTHSYQQLIIATGSSARLPDINGIHKTGVYTFRNLKDTQALLSRQSRSRHTVVIGGGLLGLEAAYAMRRMNTQVSVIDHNLYLMFHQLDEPAGQQLQAHMESLGIQVLTDNSVVEVVGDTVTGVVLRDGQRLDCDTVIVAAGITANTQLALESGIAIGRGIKVDEHLQTSLPDIYAIGECAEHEAIVYGVVAPGYEQAAVLAHHLTNQKTGLLADKHEPVRYGGSITATRLKVAGTQVYSMGTKDVDKTSGHRAYTYRDTAQNRYRKMIVHRGRLAGAVVLGDYAETQRLQDAVVQHRRVWLWQRRRWQRQGRLWKDSGQKVSEWPADAIVCQCMGISRGQLTDCLQQTPPGDCTAQQLADTTGASTVCGTCKPLVTELVTDYAPDAASVFEPVRAFKTLATLSLMGLLAIAAYFLLPTIPFVETIQSGVALGWQWDELWRDSWFKQISGFTVLGLTAVLLLLSIRKRLSVRWLDFAWWRVVHIGLGVLTLGGLLAHTGLRFGSNINFYLMSFFAALILVGTVAGLAIAFEHRLKPSVAQVIRRQSLWLHIVLFWPVPVLLGFHIFKTYYY